MRSRRALSNSLTERLANLMIFIFFPKINIYAINKKIFIINNQL